MQEEDLLKNKNENKVLLIGGLDSTPTYSHNYNGEDYYSIRVRVERTNKKKVDSIHVFLSKNLIDIDKLIKSEVRVKIEGRIIQSKLSGKKDISVLASSIELVDDSLEDTSELTLSGNLYRSFDLVKINNSNKVIKTFLLEHKDDNCRVLAKLSCWDSTAKLVDSKFSEGDKILTKCRIVSNKVKSNNSGEEKLVTVHECIAFTVFKLEE